MKSIADMLKSGIHKPTRKRLYELAWGPQYDKKRRSSAGLRRAQGSIRARGVALLRVRRATSEEPDRTGELRGRRGEAMPPESDWGA